MDVYEDISGEAWRDWAEVWNAPERIEQAKRRDAEMRQKYYRIITLTQGDT